MLFLTKYETVPVTSMYTSSRLEVCDSNIPMLIITSVHSFDNMFMTRAVVTFIGDNKNGHACVRSYPSTLFVEHFLDASLGISRHCCSISIRSERSLWRYLHESLRTTRPSTS